MEHSRFTRGTGYLEPYLARQRARQANKLIPGNLRYGRILDIGCGSYPYFLSHTTFKEKFAIDNQPALNLPVDIQRYDLDLLSNPYLPFLDQYFNVITMLAVIEHLNPANLVILFSEAYRTLDAGGLVILTTPASWSYCSRLPNNISSRAFRSILYCSSIDRINVSKRFLRYIFASTFFHFG